ncbi:MAG: histidinol phosphate aminotransferase apoenzyme (EC 2.6.1.9) [Glomeribacter sp. 1016415]|nr:histidinol phosphate aminotransferase apoenzyme (EC 2.6.1.9) [Glomeribacter sp. 1016415]
MLNPENLIRPEVLAMTRYAVTDADGLIKLDAMENPFPLPEPLAHELGQRLSQLALNRYPAPHPSALIEKLKRMMDVPSGCDVLLGNGSDEIISMLAVACARPGAKVLTPVPSFVMYEQTARLAQLEFIGVPLKDDFTLDTQAMLLALEHHQPALVYLAYPNNPTGNLFDTDALEQIIGAAHASLVVIDEAYQPFAEHSWMKRLTEFKNVLVMRTFSKLGLAGIRLGYLVGAPAWLAQIDKVRPPYNTNVLTQAAAEFLLDHLTLFDKQAALLRAERARLATLLAQLPELTVYPSAGNFLLVRTPDAQRVFDHLLAQRILVKNLSKMHPLLLHCLRLTVGAPSENEQLLAALKTALVEA